MTSPTHTGEHRPQDARPTATTTAARTPPPSAHPVLHERTLVRSLAAWQPLAGNRALAGAVAAVQRDGEEDGTGSSAEAGGLVQADQLQAMLRNIPVETPEQVSAAEKMFGNLLTVADGVAQGATGRATPIPLVAAPRNVTALVQALQQEQYDQVIASILPVIGDVALATQLVTEAALTAGIFEAGAGLSTAAMTATTAGLVAEAASPAALGLAVLVGTFMIPVEANENLAKIFFIGDLSGILTSWLWNDPTINPHAQVTDEASTEGVGAAASAAHAKAREVWAAQFRDRPERIRATRASVGEDYQVFWRTLGRALEEQLRPFPDGSAVSNINRLMRGVRLRRRERQQAEEARERAETERRQGVTYLDEQGYLWTLPGVE